MRLSLVFLSRFLIVLLVLKSVQLIVDLDLLDRLWLLEFGLVLSVIFAGFLVLVVVSTLVENIMLLVFWLFGLALGGK